MVTGVGDGVSSAVKGVGLGAGSLIKGTGKGAGQVWAFNCLMILFKFLTLSSILTLDCGWYYWWGGTYHQRY